MMGAGMMDCKKALMEAEGDFQGAIDLLRKKGIAKAAKREERETKEGVVIAQTNADQTVGVIVALQCETDFVARNDGFIAVTQKMADIALDKQPASLDALLDLSYEGDLSIRDKVGEQNGVIGEKIELGHYALVSGEMVMPYNHSNNKRSVLVVLSKGGFDEAGRNVAMQIAAMNPVSVSKDDVAPEIVEKEIEIGKELARNEGKPEAMLEKIAMGRLNKFFQENTLLSQKFVKDGSQTVAQYLQSLDKDLTVKAFKHVSL